MPPKESPWKYVILKQGDFEFVVIVPTTLDISNLTECMNNDLRAKVDAGIIQQFKPLVEVSYGYLGDLSVDFMTTVPGLPHRPEDAILIHNYPNDLGFRPR